MPFVIVRNDIVNMQVDAIVNTANPRPVIGSGTDAAIHAKAGPRLLQARREIGAIRPGCAAITPAYDLPATYVIHTAGPVWLGGFLGEAAKLRRCYNASLRLARENGCRSIAFPLISTGNYGFPKDKALQIAVSAFSEFLMEADMEIYLVVWDRDSFRLSEKLFSSVASYIDEHYVEEKKLEEYIEFPSVDYGFTENRGNWTADAPADYDMADYDMADYSCSMPGRAYEAALPLEAPMPAPMAASKSCSLEDWLKQTDAGFSETLLNLIDKTGKKDSEIYKKANLSKQHFSKIRNNPDYKPTKATAISLALALELDLEETRDLIGRAGYALTNSSKFDLIVRYFIEQRRYNVVEINCVLFEHDQNLLGS